METFNWWKIVEYEVDYHEFAQHVLKQLRIYYPGFFKESAIRSLQSSWDSREGVGGLSWLKVLPRLLDVFLVRRRCLSRLQLSSSRLGNCAPGWVTLSTVTNASRLAAGSNLYGRRHAERIRQKWTEGDVVMVEVLLALFFIKYH